MQAGLDHSAGGLRQTTGTVPMHFHYCTEIVEARRCHEFCKDAVCSRFISTDSSFPDREHFDANLSGYTLGRVCIAELGARSHGWNRTRQHIERDPTDDVVAMYMERGKVITMQNERQIVLNPGDIALYDAARPFTHDLRTESMLLKRLPRSMVQSHYAHAGSVANRKIAEHRPLARILGIMMREALAVASAAPPAVACRFATALVDTLSAAMEMQFALPAGAERNRHDRRYESALAYVEKNLDNGHLTVDTMAVALHVSQRTLARTFAAYGTTAMQEVWGRRLAASFDTLNQGRVRQVTQAAYQCGFADLSHFCRLFKKTYGCSPGAVLARSR
jgi:AraC-like DNA-binding protein